jgi:hypothetical protein
MYSPNLSHREVLPIRPPHWEGWVVAALSLTVTLLAAGCVKPPPPYVPAYPARTAQAHCFDGVPHLPGSRPIILGGACCCTPSDELMAKLHADGVCLDLDTEGLIELYHNSGIQLATDHQRCNNLCEYGPHVVLAGKCLVPPVPGTRNYEEVVTGIVLRPPPKGKKTK